MTRLRTGVVLLIAALVLAGCAPVVDARWTPPEWPASSVRVVEMPPMPTAVASGLVPQRLRNDTIGVQARFGHLPGTGPLADPFNDAVDAIVHAAIDARVTATGTAYQPEVLPAGGGMGDRGCAAGSASLPAARVLDDPAYGPVGGSGVAVVCEVVAAAGSILGVRFRTVSGDAAGITGDSATTLYVDTATGEVVTGGALWTDAAPLAVAGDVVEAIRRDAGGMGPPPALAAGGAEAEAVRQALASTIPSTDGTFDFLLAPGFTSPVLADLGVRPTDSPELLQVDPTVVRGLASPLGLRLLDSTGAPYTPPPAVPAGRDRTDCRLLPCVALTYDDGPSTLTPGILDQLAAHHAAATFFVMGEKAQKFGDTLRRALAEGHLVENHTWNHPHLRTLTPEQVASQIRDTTAAIVSVTGVQPQAFRPPYGEYDDVVRTTAGLPLILWNVDTFDWTGVDDSELVRRAVDQPSPGSIVLQHDIQPNTARTMDAVLTGLADRGFTVVNIAQLFGGSVPSSGVWRSAR